MDRLKMHTPDLAEENFKKLAALFPNAVTEKKNENGEVVRAIDADVLRQEISAAVVEGPQERYQFTWPDKKKAIILANTPIAKTLRLDREKSVGRDGTPGGIDTENIYIEGDNLDALKLLQETYLGKVKMIYIDPPYNTGKDSFVYDDDRSMSKGEFSTASGQYDEDGNMLFDMRVNNEANGQFHTDWLNMIYPRLKVAKDLLSNDGVIFISIDDNEQENLKKICDEVFGSNNFVENLVWKKMYGGKVDSKLFAHYHDYILVYAKNKNSWIPNLLPRSDASKARYKNPDNDPRGPWKAADFTGAGSTSTTYAVTSPTGRVFYPPAGKHWVVSKENCDNLLRDRRLWFGAKGDSFPSIKRFLSEVKEGVPQISIMDYAEVGHSDEAKRQLRTLIGGNYFDYPKPVRLLQRLAYLGTYKDSIILDFFSGSATTAHAVMQLNAEDGGSRKFIMVQIPEYTYKAKTKKYTDKDGKEQEQYVIDPETNYPVVDKDHAARKAGYYTVTQIGEERIRRAGKKIKEETGADIDYGFRVFRVDSSNMLDVYYRPDQYVEYRQMRLFAENIKPDRTPEDLLIQVMLDMGVSLSSDIEESEIGGKRVFSVAGGYLIACFDSDVTEETVKAIAQMQPRCAVFRDSGMAGDSVIANFEQIFETYSPKTQRKVL